MDIKSRAILRKAISHYGRDCQKFKVIEELGELTVEASRMDSKRYKKANMVTEIADSTIMIEYLKIMNDISDAEIEQEMKYKLARLNARIEGYDID